MASIKQTNGHIKSRDVNRLLLLPQAEFSLLLILKKYIVYKLFEKFDT